MVWVSAMLVFVGLLLATTPLADVYSAPLIAAPNPQKSDVIVLLSSGLIDPEWLTTDGAQRTWGALKLYTEHYAPKIISCGNPPASIQAAMLMRAGVPKSAIIVENVASNTHWSAVAVARIMKDHDWRSAVIVTSQMDVPRVRLVFAKVGVETSFLPVPEFRKPMDFHFFRNSAFDISYHATYEYAALISYRWHGWL
jgi:uncharacterized SAM-binding protein YcdF (DUF218 family)